MIRFELQLPPSLNAPYQARRWVLELGMPLQPDRADAARLLVSELVTSSVKHSRECDTGEIDIVLEAKNGTVRVEVTDPVTASEPAAEESDEASDWSFHLVDKFADRWGVTENGRRRLWFEMDVYRI